MRKSACIWFFSVVLLAPIGVTLATLQVHKYKIEKKLFSTLVLEMDRSDLIYLEFSKDKANTELEWEHSKEFEYKGEMYDVVFSEEAGDTLKFWCWHDQKETHLYKQLSALLQLHPLNEAQKAHNTSIENFLHLKYLVPQITAFIQLFFHQEPLVGIIKASFTIEGFPLIPSLPPEKR